MSLDSPRTDSKLGAPAASRGAVRDALGHFALLVALVLGALLRTSHTGALVGAVIWLPSGIAIAGLWLLGARAWWVVGFAATLLRIQLGYPALAVLTGAAGATIEALAGLWVLRRLGVDSGFARLRDVIGLLAVAAVAPLTSFAVAIAGRLMLFTHELESVYSGWDRWWRMNALGVLIVVPLVSAWNSKRHAERSKKLPVEAAAIAAGALALLALVLRTSGDSSIAILLLYVVLPIALYAAVRVGPIGAASTAALAALMVTEAADRGFGPFLAVDADERYVTLQIFTFALATVPLVMGALIAERENALESRVRSDAARNALQRILPDVTCRLRADGVILDLYVPSTETPEPGLRSLVGHSLLALVPADLAERLRAAIDAALQGAAVTGHEAQLELGGRTRFCEARFVRYSDDEVLCLLRDIGARKLDERSVELHARVLEQIAKGRPSRESLSTLVDGIEQLLDGAMASLLLLEGQRLRLGYAPSLPASYNAAIDGAQIGPDVGSCGQATYFGRTVVTPDIFVDPAWRRFEHLARAAGVSACWSVPVRAASGAVLGAFAVYYREPRTPTPAELALVERAAALAGVAIDREEREGLLASINRNINEGLFRSAPGRGFLYVNDAIVRMFGYGSIEQMMAANPADLFVVPARREHILAQLAEGGAITSEEVELRRRDGTTFWALVCAAATRTADGRVEHFDGAITDVTQRRALEEKLRQAQKMEAVGRLAGGVAHDFNNLLTAIGGYAELLVEGLPPESSGRQDAQRILKASDRAASLTRQLLAYSRQQVFSAQRHDLARIVDDLGDLLRRLIGEHIRLTIEHAAREAFVHVDRGQVEQVVLNLALNARDALPNGGSLTIRTEPVELDADFVSGHADLRAGRYLRLTVVDDGVGMDEVTRQRAFDPFFTTKEQGKGTGLGLSTVYGIVRQSGGLVLLDSAPGQGATVSVYLPRSEAPLLESRRDERPLADRAQRQGLVLVAEDETMVREIVTRALREAGYEVLEAENGAQALDVARARLPALTLVVTDRIMPRMGGDVLVENLHRERRDLPVLFMSGYAEVSPSVLDSALVDHIQKPFTRAELMRSVAELLQRARSFGRAAQA
jgi:PAS domain S-box-containing protein